MAFQKACPKNPIVNIDTDAGYCDCYVSLATARQ